MLKQIQELTVEFVLGVLPLSPHKTVRQSPSLMKNFLIILLTLG